MKLLPSATNHFFAAKALCSEPALDWLQRIVWPGMITTGLALLNQFIKAAETKEIQDKQLEDSRMEAMNQAETKTEDVASSPSPSKPSELA